MRHCIECFPHYQPNSHRWEQIVWERVVATELSMVFNLQVKNWSLGRFSSLPKPHCYSPSPSSWIAPIASWLVFLTAFVPHVIFYTDNSGKCSGEHGISNHPHSSVHQGKEPTPVSDRDTNRPGKDNTNWPHRQKRPKTYRWLCLHLKVKKKKQERPPMQPRSQRTGIKLQMS